MGLEEGGIEGGGNVVVVVVKVLDWWLVTDTCKEWCLFLFFLYRRKVEYHWWLLGFRGRGLGAKVR